MSKPRWLYWTAFIVSFAAVLWIMFPISGGNTKDGARSTACLSNLKQLGVAFSLYTEENSSRLPPTKFWIDRLEPFLKYKDPFSCPGLWRNGEPNGFGYAMNQFMNGAKIDEALAEKMPVLWDSNQLQRNAAEYWPNLPVPSRHNKKNNVLFADAHVKGYRTEPND
ncbi:MAG: hypothetical protein ACAH95_05630 [Fimbriimonas sp.]